MKEIFWIILFTVIFSIAILAGTLFVESQKCKNKFFSFENRWGIFSQCQIKVDGKWIPAESYYIKEDYQK